MILHVYSDGSYLSVGKGRIRVGGYYFLSNLVSNPAHVKFNSAINVLYAILKNLMSSATKVEIAVTFNNAREALPLKHVLKFLGHPQLPTPI